MVKHILYIMAYNLVSKCDFQIQLKLKHCNKYLFKMVKIESVPQVLIKSLTDDILQCLNLRELNLTKNQQITDVGLQNLTNLRELNLIWNEKITDIGLQNLSSHCKIIR